MEIKGVCGYVGHTFVMVFRTRGIDGQNLFPYYYCFMIITFLLLRL